MKSVKLSLATAMLLTFSNLAAFAHEYARGDLKIDHPWARPSMAAHVPAAVYLEINNSGDEDDRLIAAKTDRAEHVELHRSVTDDAGVVRMQLSKEGVDAPANTTVSMETGGYHIMLIGLGEKLAVGEEFPMTLTFEKAGDVEVIVYVEDREKKNGAHAHH